MDQWSPHSGAVILPPCGRTVKFLSLFLYFNLLRFMQIKFVLLALLFYELNTFERFQMCCYLCFIVMQQQNWNR